MKRLLLNNMPLKVLSLVLTIILFVLVRGDSIRTFDADIVVSASRTPEGFVLIEPLPQSLRVGLRGRWSQIEKALRAKSGDPYSVDIAAMADGKEHLVDREKLRLLLGPNPPEITNVIPESFKIKIEALSRKELPVRAYIEGEVARGYALKKGAIVIAPDRVVLSGLEAEIAEVNEILTATLDVSNLTNDTTLEGVLLRLPSGQHLSLSPGRVTVRLPIEEVEERRVLPEVRVVIEGCQPERDCAVEPATVPVELVGPLHLIEEISASPQANLVYVDARELSATVGKRRVAVLAREDPRLQIKPLGRRVTLDVLELSSAEPPVVRDLVEPEGEEPEQGEE